MPILVYLAVICVAAGSVLFGLDWLSAPLSPMPNITVAARYLPPPAPPRTVAPPPAPVIVAPASPSILAPQPPVIAAAPPSIPQADVLAPADAPPPLVAEEPPQPKCDVDACTEAYRSFRAADCTYQPSFGPRRLCTKGTPPPDSASATPAAAPQPPASCNVAACSAAYFSFTASDCTYQPTDGPRRLCTK